MMGVFQNYKILTLVDSIHDAVTISALLILHLILWFHSDRITTSLGHFISSQLSSFSDEKFFNSSKAFIYLSISLDFFTIPANYIVYYLVEPEDTFNIMVLLLQYYKITLVLYLINHLKILLRMTQHFVRDVLMAVFKPIIEESDAILSPQMHKKGFVSIDVVNLTTNRKIAHTKHACVETGAAAADLETAANFPRMKKVIINSFQFLRHVRSYVNKGLVPAMLCLLLWLVIATYYLVLWSALGPNQRFMAVTQFFTAIIPVVTLLEASMGFNASVSHFANDEPELQYRHFKEFDRMEYVSKHPF